MFVCVFSLIRMEPVEGFPGILVWPECHLRELRAFNFQFLVISNNRFVMRSSKAVATLIPRNAVL